VAWAPPYLVAGGGQSLPPTQLTLDGDEVFRGPELDEPLFYHHEARGVDVDGTAGILTLATTILDKANATYSTAQAGFRAEVHDPATGELLWTWDVSDHLDDWGPPAPKVDPWHANAMTWEGDGHSWISARGTNHVTRIDRTTGRATHVLGADGTVTLLDADGNERPSDDWFSGQHGPAQHGDRLFLLDNGRTRRGFSRAVEYRLDLVASTATEAWTWTEDGWFEPYYGNVDLLPGGHVLVASGHCNRCDGTGGPERRAFAAEIDQATNEVLWRMDFVDPGASLFRAQYVAPCDLFHHVGRCTE
jgi:hypothetical protein